MHRAIHSNKALRFFLSFFFFFSLSPPSFLSSCRTTRLIGVNSSAERGIVDCPGYVDHEGGIENVARWWKGGGDVYVYKKVEWTIEIDTHTHSRVCVFIERSKRESKGDVSEGWKMVATGIYTSAYGHE